MKLQIRKKDASAGFFTSEEHARLIIPSNAVVERHAVVGEAPLGAGITV